MVAWVPSQNGLFEEPPDRHIAIGSGCSISWRPARCCLSSVFASALASRLGAATLVAGEAQGRGHTVPSRQHGSLMTRNKVWILQPRWRDPDSNRGHHDFQSCGPASEAAGFAGISDRSGTNPVSGFLRTLRRFPWRKGQRRGSSAFSPRASVQAHLRPRCMRVSAHVPMELSSPPAVPARAPSSHGWRRGPGGGRASGRSRWRRRPRRGGCALVDHGRAADLRSSLVAPRWPQPCRRAF